MTESLSEEDIKERIEHQNVMLDLRVVLSTSNGINVFKYLFKHLQVTELPEIGLVGDLLMDRMGFLRAGNSIFKLVAEADVEKAASILAHTEKERHAELFNQT